MNPIYENNIIVILHRASSVLIYNNIAYSKFHSYRVSGVRTNLHDRMHYKCIPSRSCCHIVIEWFQNIIWCVFCCSWFPRIKLGRAPMGTTWIAMKMLMTSSNLLTWLLQKLKEDQQIIWRCETSSVVIFLCPRLLQGAYCVCRIRCLPSTCWLKF